MKYINRLLIFSLIGVCAYFAITAGIAENKNASKTTEANLEIKGATLKFGYDVSEFNFDENVIEKNEMLSTILTGYSVPYPTIHEIAEKASDVFDVRNLRVGKPFTVVMDSCDVPEAFVYTPNAYKYVKYSFKDSVYVDVVEHPIEKIVAKGSGELNSSLWQSMLDADLSPTLITRMEDALAWTIDFHYAQKGDKYKLIYEKEVIDGEEVGTGRLLGAYYKNYDNEFYAIWYDNEAYSGFYDLTGRPTKKTFLKSPVKFSRISSAFSMSRYHPILKRRKPHFGTDYAAPHGTPILAVANGVVTNASFTRGNGNYVKIKHNNVYQTQYLHMSRFATGINKGVHVKQGQVIGYVGSTGLATGPHVCFRFWKNGKQIDHRRENFPPAEPMPEDQLPAFYSFRDSIVQELNNIEFMDIHDDCKDEEEQLP